MDIKTIALKMATEVLRVASEEAHALLIHIEQEKVAKVQAADALAKQLPRVGAFMQVSQNIKGFGELNDGKQYRKGD